MKVVLFINVFRSFTSERDELRIDADEQARESEPGRAEARHPVGAGTNDSIR